jgi:glycosyltransferase domain-containing protein
MFKYTIVVPTHNRHDYLERSMRYFSCFEANVIYVDSSVKAYKGDFSDNIQYIHLEGMSFPQKALYAIDKCQTEYIAFCADDDFLIEASVLQGVDKLNGDNSCTAVVGRYIGFDEKFSGDFFEILNYSEWPLVNLDNKANVANFFSSYHQILWSLYNKDAIKLAYEIISEAKFSNDNFIEIVIGTVCAGSGGIMFIDDSWGVREISLTQHWGNRHKSLREIHKTTGIQQDIALFNKLIAEKLQPGLGEIALHNYFFSNKNSLSRALLDFVKVFIPPKLKCFLTEKRRRLCERSNTLDNIAEILNDKII